MKRPVLLIIANVVIVLAVVGSLARSLVSAPSEHSTAPKSSISQQVPSDSVFEAYPGTEAHNIAAPSLVVDVTPGSQANSYLVKGQTEVGNTVTVNGVPVTVSESGIFSTLLKNGSSTCTVQATSPEGISSQVVKLLEEPEIPHAKPAQYVPYGSR